MVNAMPWVAFPPWNRPSTHCTGGWVGPRACLDGCNKSCPPLGFDPQQVQPVINHYTKLPAANNANIYWKYDSAIPNKIIQHLEPNYKKQNGVKPPFFVPKHHPHTQCTAVSDALFLKVLHCCMSFRILGTTLLHSQNDHFGKKNKLGSSVNIYIFMFIP
jgi:hypothetical protein